MLNDLTHRSDAGIAEKASILILHALCISEVEEQNQETVSISP
jgi:hypothetical protein